MNEFRCITMSCNSEARMQRALVSLDGLSVGDAFGERFFSVRNIERMIAQRAFPRKPWHYTDDTEMALGIVEILDRHGRIEQDELAAVFARRYAAAPHRGYGATAHEILEAIGLGTPWQSAARSAFHGAGSMGNGGAMRVAPLGAYWADDLEMAARQAQASAEVTHAHAEGQAGAIAVAVAAAWAARRGAGETVGPPGEMIELAMAYTPKGETRTGLRRAIALLDDASMGTVALILGNGSKITAPDTVPFALWCAARHIDDYAEALWTAVAALGDIDTNCAIIGGIVALAAGQKAIPAEWILSREPLATCDD